MDGRSECYGWNFDGKKRQDEPSLSGANIQVTYLKSRWNPFLILEDGDGINEKGHKGPEIDRYAGRWSEFSDFPWRNHWPVTQDYVIGRYACVADAAAHTYTATQYDAPHSIEGDKMTKLMLCGCTEGDAASLLPLAKSWLRAPRMTCNGEEVPYDVTQRAYVAQGKSGVFRVEASTEHPVNGLCLIIKGDVNAKDISLDGNPCPGAKTGVINAWDGKSLIIWLDVKSVKPFEIAL